MQIVVAKDMMSARVTLAMEIEESTFISGLDVPHNEQQCHCADVGMRIAVQMQKFAFQARVWTRPATAPAPALLVTKRVPAQNTNTIATGRVAARQLPSTTLTSRPLASSSFLVTVWTAHLT